jgi:hypothetical protein
MNFTAETLLDLTVNFIPIGILVGMELLFLVHNPWDWDPWIVFWMHFLTVFPLLMLTLLTYVSGRVIQRDEQRLGGHEGSVEATDD